MFNLELSRAVELDRRREIDQHLDHRRAMRDQAEAASRTGCTEPSPRAAARQGAALRQVR